MNFSFDTLRQCQLNEITTIEMCEFSFNAFRTDPFDAWDVVTV